MNPKSSALASLAAALVGVQVGSAIVATRFVIDHTHPGSLALLRYSIGIVCLLLPLLASARVPFAKRDLLPLSLLGIIQFGVVVVLLNYALQFIPSARAAPGPLIARRLICGQGPTDRIPMNSQSPANGPLG